MAKVWQSTVKHLDVIIILVASAGAIVLFHLDILPEAYVISFVLFLLAVHTLQEAIRGEEVRRDVKAVSQCVAAPEPEIEIIKPADLLLRTEEFALRNQGEGWWFNACASMFYSQELFNKLLRSSMENPRTIKIFFVLRPAMKDLWEREVQPKIGRCSGREKVQPIIWRDIEESIAFLVKHRLKRV
jgi:hypothetical protein